MATRAKKKREWTGRRVESLRHKLGLTQEAFAAQLGVSFTAINRWENDSQKPSKLAVSALDRLEELAKRRS